MDVVGLLKWLGGIGLEEIFLFMILVVGINALRFIREKCPTFRRYIFDPIHRTWLRFRLRIHGLRIKRAIEANDEGLGGPCLALGAAFVLERYGKAHCVS